jgi:hypothetical protein
LSAEIIVLNDWRTATDADLDIDLRTAVDVAVRDLQEIKSRWGDDVAFRRLIECEAMLKSVLASR